MVHTSYPQVQLAAHVTHMSNTLQNVMPRVDTQCTCGDAMTRVYNLMSAHCRDLTIAIISHCHVIDVTGPAKTNHVSGNYTESYFSGILRT